MKSKTNVHVRTCFFQSSHPLYFLCRFKNRQTSIKNDDSYVIHENGTLEINVAQPINSGKYTCIATNNLGIKENHVFLEVKGQIWTNHNRCLYFCSHHAVLFIHFLSSRAHPYPEAARVQGGAERNECHIRVQSQT